MLGGFGNCQGEMSFWDISKKKIIGTCQDPDGAKYLGWAPDGRVLVSAVLHPWRRVSNGYRVWSYAGELLMHVKAEELWQVVVRPAPAGSFPDRPQSPRLKDKNFEAEREAAQKAQAAVKQVCGVLRFEIALCRVELRSLGLRAAPSSWESRGRRDPRSSARISGSCPSGEVSGRTSERGTSKRQHCEEAGELGVQGGWLCA